jgi:hypothetical protein
MPKDQRIANTQKTAKTTELPDGESVSVVFIHEEVESTDEGPAIVCSSVYQIVVDNELNDRSFKEVFVSADEAKELKKILGSFGL